MKENHVLALIIAYYLSKFDKIAYKKLGYTNQKITHNEIGRILSVNPNSVKNMRDEFDPLHGKRKGWYQRDLRASRFKVVEAFQDLTEKEFYDVVLEILTNHKYSASDELKGLISLIAKKDKKSTKKSVFIIRGPTGHKAEEMFIKFNHETGKPVSGIMKDTRDLGCGYDFEIDDGEQRYYIEVKGLDGDSGGIQFTSSEWDMAIQSGSFFYLVIIRNISKIPEIQIIQNPAALLFPKKSVFTTVQVRWNVPDCDLLTIRDNIKYLRP